MRFLSDVILRRICFCILLLATPAAFGRSIAGSVLDQSGARITGAHVELRDGHATRPQLTDLQGNFAYQDVPSGRVRLRVEAAGFAIYESAVSAQTATLEIILRPVSVNESVTVAATRMPVSEDLVAADVTLINSNAIRSEPGLMTDDVLHHAIGFSLFRRSDSRTANPTSQGVSLRGVGASGASRAVVLYDGIPMNDTFGDWVQWDRIPKLSLSEIEVVRGGVSDLYGAGALSGVVSLEPRQPSSNVLNVELSGGNSLQPDFSIFAGSAWHGWQASTSIETMRSPGYFVISPANRGNVDRPVGLDFQNGSVSLARAISSQSRIALDLEMFSESRNNGTALQLNSTHLGQVAFRSDFGSASTGQFSVLLYSTGERYHQDFSSIATDRNSELYTRRQIVPSTAVGARLQWRRATGRFHHPVAGVDWRHVKGHSEEGAFVSGIHTSNVDSGGQINLLGLFAEDYVQLGKRFFFSGALRADLWRNDDGFTATSPLSTLLATRTNFVPRSRGMLSPRLTSGFKATQQLTVTASVYRSFRAPTLNELYRSFRLGNIQTLANADLRAERLTGAEGGLKIGSGPAKLRADFFWARIDDPVTNTTLIVTPALITRERLNAGANRARGLELEGTWQWQRLLLSAGYQWTDSRVISDPANLVLVGLRVQQVPANQFSFSAHYNTPRNWTLVLQGRGAGVQFDDDQNLLPLNAYSQFDGLIVRRITSQLQGFVGVENIFDQRAITALSPLATLGPPTLARVGIRLNLGNR